MLKDIPQAKESANTINETFWLRYMVLTPPPTPPHPFKNSYWLHPHFPFLSSNSFHLISLASSSLVTTSSVALMSLALRDVTVTCQARVLPDVWAQRLSRVVNRLGKLGWTWETCGILFAYLLGSMNWLSCLTIFTLKFLIYKIRSQSNDLLSVSSCDSFF